jgi:hypothetical protein
MTPAIIKTIRAAIIDCTVTDRRTGEEVVNVSACYLALVHDLQDTMPHDVPLSVEWGPCRTHNRRAVEQAPAWVWEAALGGRLVLDEYEGLTVSG